jgi:hypothetical protein
MSGTVATSQRLRALFDILRAAPGWVSNGHILRALAARGHYSAALHSDIADLRRDPALAGWNIPPARVLSIQDPDGTRRRVYYYCIHRGHRRAPELTQPEGVGLKEPAA